MSIEGGERDVEKAETETPENTEESGGEASEVSKKEIDSEGDADNLDGGDDIDDEEEPEDEEDGDTDGTKDGTEGSDTEGANDGESDEPETETESGDKTKETEETDKPLTKEEAQQKMGDYYASHNYGKEDYATYSKDPEWQKLNAEYKKAHGLDNQGTAEGGAESENNDKPITKAEAQQKLMEYYNSHNYGQEHYPIYSKDPEWQKLNDQYIDADERENGDKVELNNTLLDMEDLKGTGSNPDELPDKSEFIEYGDADGSKDLSDRAYEKYSKKADKALPYEEKNALNEYSQEQSQAGYERINKELRGQPAGYTTDFQKQRVSENIDKISSAIDKQKLPKDMTLYRGISSPGIVLGKDWESKSLDQLNSECNGKVFEEKAFCSTSTKEAKARDFETAKGAIMNIEAPKGANGVFMGKVSAYSENEVLLQKGSCFEIKSIEKDNYGNIVINAKLIGRREG